jgi:hypothetical protein
VLGREAGAWADLGFVAGGDGDGESGLGEVDAAGLDGDGFEVGREERGEIEARGKLRVVLRRMARESSLRTLSIGAVMPRA